MSPYLKIAFLLDIPEDTGSWVGRYAPWARYLSEAGHTVKVFLPVHGFDPKQTERGYLSAIGPALFEKNEGGRRQYGSGALILIAIRNFFRMARELNRFSPDVVIVGKPLPISTTVALLWKAFSGKRAILDCDDLEVETNTFRSNFQRSVIAFFENVTPRLFTAVTTHTRFNYERLLKAGVRESRISMIVNGVDPERFQKAIEIANPSPNVVLYCGDLNLDTGHNVDLLIQAFPRVRQTAPNAQFWLVGDGKHERELKAMAKDLGIESALTWHGRVSPGEAARFLHAATVIVDPVKKIPANHSRCPLKIIEGLYLGKTVVTSDVGDRAELLAGRGVLVAPDSAEALAKGILLALQSKVSVEKPELQRVRERFSWVNLVAKFQAQCLKGATV